MTTITLKEAVEQRGQARVARALGMSPPSVGKAIDAGRNVMVTVSRNGSMVATETRPFPFQKKVRGEAEKKDGA